MNKIILIIIAVVVVGAGGYYMYSTNGTGSVSDDQEQHDPDSSVSSASSIRAMIESGKDISCTFAHSDEFASQNGTVYISNERMRGDFTITQESVGSFDAHMIRDGEWAYTWGDPSGQKIGAKISLANLEGDSDSESGPDLDQELDLKCDTWSVDESFFIPPTDIEFTDFAAQLEQIQAATGDVKDAQCSACARVPDAEGQAQCRLALDC